MHTQDDAARASEAEDAYDECPPGGRLAMFADFCRNSRLVRRVYTKPLAGGHVPAVVVECKQDGMPLEIETQMANLDLREHLTERTSSTTGRKTTRAIVVDADAAV